MEAGRCMELLNSIVDYVSCARNTSETVRELTAMGFSEEELILYFSFSKDDMPEGEDE